MGGALGGVAVIAQVCRRIALASRRHPRRVLVGAAVLSALSAAIGLPPRVDANVVALLPPDDPHAAALRRIAAETGGINQIQLTFTGPEPALGDTLDALARQLEALPDVAYALHRLPGDLEAHVALMGLDPATATDDDLRGALTSYAVADAGGLGRILVKPTQSNIDPAFCERVVGDVHRVVAQADLAAHGVTHVFSAGPYVYIADGAEGIREDLRRTTGISVALVAVVLAVGLRGWRAPLVAAAPIAVAALAHLAWMKLVFGTLNGFTSFGTALLFGLGVDTSIHLIRAFQEDRGRGLDVDGAVAAAWARIGPPCVTAVATSAAAFASLGVASFRGLSQLGVSLAVGLGLCLVATLALLPPLMRYVDRPLPPSPTEASRSRASAWPLVAFAALTTLVLTTGLPKLAFEYDITAMNRDRMAFSSLDDATRALIRRAYPPIVVDAADVAAARSEHIRLEAALHDGRLPHVRDVLSIESLLPSDQAGRVAAWSARREQMSDVPPAFAAWAPRPRAPEELPEGLLALVGGGARVLLVPQGDLYDLRESAALIDELAAVAPGAASEQTAQGAVYRALVADAPWVVGLAFVAVAVLTAVDLRRPTLVLAVLLSLVVGVAWAFAGVGWIGQRLTLMNLVGVPMVLGLGVDVVVHLGHRLRGGDDVDAAVRSVGAPTITSVATTVASFVALLATSSGGIRSLGGFVVVGLTLGTAAAAVCLIALTRASVARRDAP